MDKKLADFKLSLKASFRDILSSSITSLITSSQKLTQETSTKPNLPLQLLSQEQPNLQLQLQSQPQPQLQPHSQLQP